MPPVIIVMKKYLITWDVGYGKYTKIIEANSQQDAEERAYQAYQDALSSKHTHDYYAEIWEDY